MKSMNRIKYICIVTLLVTISLSLFSLPSHAAEADLTTKYRVYQFDNLLKEFADSKEAIAYARNYSFSYVEEIGSRQWIYHDFPRYEVYQYDIYIGTYSTLDDAKQEAQKWSNSTIRDVHTKGWLWNNYPKYQLFQGDVSLNNWKFTSLESAKLVAAKWANSHIIDLNNNEWVWDNISQVKKTELRNRTNLKYQVFQLNYTQEDWKFAYKEDAIKEALNWKNSYIINTTTDKKVYSNENNFIVYQNSTELEGFIAIEDAIEYAKRWAHATIRTTTDREIWTNFPYYQVHMTSKNPEEFVTLLEAMNYALNQPKSWITNARGQMVWDNSTRLMYWAWTGSATDSTIRKRVSETVGLDVLSPTWFKLIDAQGNVEDTTSPEIVRWLKERDIEIHPLVQNQFSSKLTTAFLNNEQGQNKFIETIVNRSSELGLDGINVDFESMSGSDRSAYTLFMKKLTAAAHLENLKISIDLPRGSVAWNHLTAFDHAELAKVVDYIITMTYDHHYSGSTTPGPVAGMSWTENGVKEFLSYGIPRDKLIMGIPFYIREWKLDETGKLISNRAIYSSGVANILETKDVTSKWDSNYGLYRMEYEEDGYTYVFWLEDEASIKSRIDIAKDYNLSGIAAWRLGQEAAELWKAMLLEK